jgi:sec-independent protein translocase protein TatA
MMGLGWQELTIILLIVVVIFGVGKLPELGSGLGKGIRDFKLLAADDGAEPVAVGTRQDGDTARGQTGGTRELRADQI